MSASLKTSRRFSQRSKLPIGTCTLASCEGNIGAGGTANPEYSLSNASTPADSNLIRQSSNAWVEIFVVRGCTSRPAGRSASCLKYHQKRNGLPIKGRGQASTWATSDTPHLVAV